MDTRHAGCEQMPSITPRLEESLLENWLSEGSSFHFFFLQFRSTKPRVLKRKTGCRAPFGYLVITSPAAFLPEQAQWQ